MAYNGLKTAFDNYRGRVIEEYGAEADERLRLGVTTEKALDEKGKSKSVQKMTANPESEYLFEFNQDNMNWVPNQEHNLFFVSRHQVVANDLLRSRGQLFLSEVLDMLGIERTPASIVTGWLYEPNKKLDGDGEVNFGINDTFHSDGKILLDFNVDGVIFDKI